MAWPATAVVTGDHVTSAQLNGLPVRIADTTLGADALITFTSVPQHYAHLMVTYYLRSAVAALSDQLVVRFNGDTAANYDYQAVAGAAATAAAFEGLATASPLVNDLVGNTSGANLFSPGRLTIPHYANATNHKAVMAPGGFKRGTASGNLSSSRYAAFWRSTAAITTVALLPLAGATFKSGSRATLYGYP